MCRLFGFRSVINSQVHHSLIDADNAIEKQAGHHPDGWGVAYYFHGAPHVIKSTDSAFSDSLFKKISGVVSSQTVLAHIRKATLGEKTILNTHPFQFGKWTFAHNGNIKNFKQHRSELLKLVDPYIQKFILGDTDSELLFFIILSHLKDNTCLENVSIQTSEILLKISEALIKIEKIIGKYSLSDLGPEETYLTFILTDGKIMAAHQGGKQLFYSSYKTDCPESGTCTSYSEECVSKSKTGKINHLLFSSEALSGKNVWLPMKNGQLIGVDQNMHFQTLETLAE